MLKDSKYTPLDIYFMMPSCVPAVEFEENSGSLTAEDLKEFINNERVLGLGEVMDVSAVINLKSSMVDKLNLFKNKIIDGHSPHISRKFLNQYMLAGIRTDHECSTSDEALEKISLGIDAFITLSFMSLPVIPNIKLTTQGLFLYENFNFIPLTFNEF